MSTLPHLSLDLPSPQGDAVHSGYNFREVAPEVLSPFTWSLVGAGMERGYRAMANELGLGAPIAARPGFVSYFGFRPYLNMTAVENVAVHLPWVDPDDIWQVYLGGAGPETGHPRAGTVRRALKLPAELSVMWAIGAAFGQVQTVLTNAESLVLRATETRSAWTTGAACDAAVEAARAAWALHTRTTCMALIGAAVLRRMLRLQYSADVALQLLCTCAQRQVDGQVASARGETLTAEQHRLANYEVADLTTAFGGFSMNSVPVPAPSAMRPAGNGRLPQAEPPIPGGTALGPLYGRMSRFLASVLGERERSKELGLRALHCARLLLDRAAFGRDPEEAALLGVGELREAGDREQQQRIARRAEELTEAARLDYPVDLREGPRGLREAARPSRGDGELRGVPLAPGWATGTLVQGDAGAPGEVVAGARVEGNHVLAALPDGVITRYGSVLSHVAIVCRELGIPLVSSVNVGAERFGSDVVVDGWAGTVSFGGRQEARAG